MDPLIVTLMMALLFTIFTFVWRADPDREGDVIVVGILSVITWMISSVTGFMTLTGAELNLVWLFFGMSIIMTAYLFMHVMLMMKAQMEE